MAIYNKITKKEISEIKKAKLTAIELAKKFKRHPMTIRNIANNMSVSLPKHSQITHRINNNVDLSFFKTWSSDMAYVLGFIAADGCVMVTPRNGGVIEIGLAYKDLSHLRKIKTIMKAKYEIKTKNTNMGTKAVRLSICSKCMVDDIIKLGIGPRKSLTLKFPKMPKKYTHHFIRGYFDGDGYIDIRKTKNSQYLQLRLSMLGTKDFLMHIKKCFSDFYGKDIGSIEDCRKHYNTHRLTFAGTKSAVTFAKYIYNNSQNKNRLTRKYRIYKKYKK